MKYPEKVNLEGHSVAFVFACFEDRKKDQLQKATWLFFRGEGSILELDCVDYTALYIY